MEQHFYRHIGTSCLLPVWLAWGRSNLNDCGVVFSLWGFTQIPFRILISDGCEFTKWLSLCRIIIIIISVPLDKLLSQWWEDWYAMVCGGPAKGVKYDDNLNKEAAEMWLKRRGSNDYFDQHSVIVAGCLLYSLVHRKLAKSTLPRSCQPQDPSCIDDMHWWVLQVKLNEWVVGEKGGGSLLFTIAP